MREKVPKLNRESSGVKITTRHTLADVHRVSNKKDGRKILCQEAGV